jgi:hypothetical protein
LYSSVQSEHAIVLFGWPRICFCVIAVGLLPSFELYLCFFILTEQPILVSAHVPRCLICAQVLISVQQVQRRTCLGVSGEPIFPSSSLSARASTPAWFFSSLVFLRLCDTPGAPVPLLIFSRSPPHRPLPLFSSPVPHAWAPVPFFSLVLLLLASYRSPTGAHQDPRSRVHSSFFSFCRSNPGNASLESSSSLQNSIFCSSMGIVTGRYQYSS